MHFSIFSTYIKEIMVALYHFTVIFLIFCVRFEESVSAASQQGSHLESVRTGAVVGSCGIRDTGAVVLAGCCQAGGALRRQADIYWT